MPRGTEPYRTSWMRTAAMRTTRRWVAHNTRGRCRGIDGRANSTQRALTSCWRHGGRSRGIHYQSEWQSHVRINIQLTPRAKSRIARQRIEVGLPLSKIVNVRKEVFGELKVGHRASQRGHAMPSHRAHARHSITLGLNSVTTDPYRPSASPPIRSTFLHHHGRAR